MKMTTDVTMPKLGLTMKEGTVVSWLKKEGERVEKGEPILEIETEKISNVVEAPATGVLLRVVAEEKTTVPVGGLLALIGEAGETVTTIERPVAVTETPAAVREKPAELAPKAEEGMAEERTRISPAARKLAEEKGLDINKIKGTGPEGRIVKEDVLKALGEETALSLLSREGVEISKTIPMTGMRKIIADRLSRSYHTAANTTVMTEVDMTEAARLREKLLLEVKEKTGAPLTYTGILVKAVAAALLEHPVVNSTIEDDNVKILRNVNVGVAIDVEGGLIVPVIRDANRKTLFEIALLLIELAQKARNRLLSIDQVSAGTFTITNLGMLGVHTFIPIINPPQTAILGVGSIEDKPVVINGKIDIRSRMNLTLVFDHRAIDGAEAARFLKTLKTILQNPLKLIS